MSVNTFRRCRKIEVVVVYVQYSSIVRMGIVRIHWQTLQIVIVKTTNSAFSYCPCLQGKAQDSSAQNSRETAKRNLVSHAKQLNFFVKMRKFVSYKILTNRQESLKN